MILPYQEIIEYVDTFNAYPDGGPPLVISPLVNTLLEQGGCTIEYYGNWYTARVGLHTSMLPHRTLVGALGALESYFHSATYKAFVDALRGPME